MPRGRTGPLRTDSFRVDRAVTRAIAIVAVLGLCAAVASDEFAEGFWERHSLLSGLVASAIVVILSVAVIDEALERRTRRRWRVLAQYVMLELVRNARLIWTGIIELTHLVPPIESPGVWTETAAGVVRETSRVSKAIGELVVDAERRRGLQDEVARLVSHSDDIIGRWAAVMLNSKTYAEVIDRHVELASELLWLGSVLDNSEPPDDVRRRKRARSHPAVQLETHIDDETLIQRVVVIAQLAEELDRSTLAKAFRIVPFDWWEARLGTAAFGDVREDLFPGV